MAWKALDLLLGKVQTSLGTKQAALDHTDFRAVDNTFDLTYNQELLPMPLTTGAMGQNKNVKGFCSVDAKISLPVVATGDTDAPNIHDFLTCSGMSAALSTNKRTYAPSIDVSTYWKDMTLWKYTGDKASGDCLLIKGHSFMFDWSLTGEVGKPTMIEFTGKGVADGAPAAASYPGTAVTMPTDFAVPVCKATSMTIAGLAFKVIKFGVQIGNKLEMIRSMGADDGYLQGYIADRESKWSATVHQENLSDLNPYTALNGLTLATSTITYGAAGSRISIVSGASKTQITAIEETDENGIKVFNLSGIFVDNDFSFIINEA